MCTDHAQHKHAIFAQKLVGEFAYGGVITDRLRRVLTEHAQVLANEVDALQDARRLCSALSITSAHLIRHKHHE